MTYEYRCRECGSVDSREFEGGLAPETYDEHCVICGHDTRWQRWYTFGVGRGSNGEPSRTPRG